jgi:hypothetical protein
MLLPVSSRKRCGIAKRVWTLLIPGAKVGDEKNAHNMIITMPLL